jgi:hypothetical protein
MVQLELSARQNLAVGDLAEWREDVAVATVIRSPGHSGLDRLQGLIGQVVVGAGPSPEDASPYRSVSVIVRHSTPMPAGYVADPEHEAGRRGYFAAFIRG